MKLFEKAHSRAGDKGNISTLSVIALNPADYKLIVENVTLERVKEHLKPIVKGDIVRYEMPNVQALLFVCQDALESGVTTSLALDPHGKTLSSYLLEMEI